MSTQISDIADLEDCIGKASAAIDLKVIDHIDDSARRWLSASPLMFAAFAARDGIDVSPGGGQAGFAQIIDEKRLRLPAAMLDRPEIAREGNGFGALFLVPTVGETLRINGRVAAVSRDAVEIAAEECYVHCAKALIRSDFWMAPPSANAPSDTKTFLAHSRFLALATADGAGNTDLSPKGDPAGTMLQQSDEAVLFADRPGNRRADSFRNMLAQPRIAAAALIPGSARVALLSGVAQIVTEETLRATFAVREKMPKLVTRIVQPQLRLYDSATLSRANLWPAQLPAGKVDPAATLVAHVRLSKMRGVQATLARAAVAIPGAMQKGLDHDYKTNLY